MKITSRYFKIVAGALEVYPEHENMLNPISYADEQCQIPKEFFKMSFNHKANAVQQIVLSLNSLQDLECFEITWSWENQKRRELT